MRSTFNVGENKCTAPITCSSAFAIRMRISRCNNFISRMIYKRLISKVNQNSICFMTSFFAISIKGEALLNNEWTSMIRSYVQKKIIVAKKKIIITFSPKNQELSNVFQMFYTRPYRVGEIYRERVVYTLKLRLPVKSDYRCSYFWR